MRSRNSFRYNGLINRRTLGVEPAKDGKGVVLVTKKAGGNVYFKFYSVRHTVLVREHRGHVSPSPLVRTGVL